MSAGRPRHLAVVAGTGTEVGKTWVAARLAASLRTRGLRVAARKPAQSFEATDATTDADLLAAATGEAPTQVCAPHRWYEVPMAPPMAADALGRAPFTITDLVQDAAWPLPPPDVGLVESAGGVQSPLADDGDTATLVTVLRPDLVLLVADAGLGTINGVRSAGAALRAADPTVPTVVLLNRFDTDDDLHRRNRAWLAERDGFDVRTDVEDVSRRIEATLVGSFEP